MRPQSQGQHTIDRLKETERRRKEHATPDDLTVKNEKGPFLVRPASDRFQRHHHQLATAVLKTEQRSMCYSTETPISADSEKNCVANSCSPTRHQTLLQRGETKQGGYIHLADWTLKVAAFEEKEKKGDIRQTSERRDRALTSFPEHVDTIFNGI